MNFPVHNGQNLDNTLKRKKSYKNEWNGPTEVVKTICQLSDMLLERFNFEPMEVSKMKVVITDFEFGDLKYEEKVLNHSDVELVYGQCKTEEEVIEFCRDADGIINQYAPISRRVIESLENCKIIARYGVGVDTIDIEAATEKGIPVGYVPDYGINEVSDHALALIMNVLRKVTITNKSVKNGVWDYAVTKPIRRLRTLTIGLVGFGNIPRRLSQKVQALGMNVIVSDPFISEEVVKDNKATLVSLNELCEQADVISVHAPLTNSTKGMLGKDQFNLMKDGVYIVNTARGPVIDESALIDAIQTGKVSGAGLDVLDKEPISSGHPFLTLDQVTLTPHMAGYSEEAYAELRSKTALALMDVLVYSQTPKYLFNKNVSEQLSLKPFTEDSHYKNLGY